MRTRSTTREEARAGRKWLLVDLDGQILGRAATRIAHILRGKHKPSFTPHVDTGDFVVVINAERVVLTGNKWEGKIYYRHTGYMGGIKAATPQQLRKHKPEELIRSAVKGMLPSGPLARAQLRKLKIYSGGAHPHGPQKPTQIDLSKFLAGGAA